jgi:hydroxymethylglutaryl-CoA lyase
MSIDVIVREVGPRDGLQILPSFMPTEAKKAWITAEVAAGVREIEVSSFVPPKLLPQLADAGEVVEHALATRGLMVHALVPNAKGAERAIAAGVHAMDFVLSVSETHNMANVRRTTAQSVEEFGRVVSFCEAAGDKAPKAIGGLSTAFGCTMEGAVSERRVIELCEALIAAGADGLIVADTVGYGNPAAVKRVFKEVVAVAGKLPVYAHFHDTRGLGLANVHAALEAGVRAFDACLGGLGGCPYAPGASGNIVMEDLVFMLEAMGLKTGVDLNALLEVRATVQKSLPDVALVGAMGKAGLPKNFARAA